MDTESILRAKYEALAPVLNERTRRLWAASEAQALGHGGIAVVARATGLSRTRIARGLQELRSDTPLDSGRVRRPAGGRKRRIDTDVTLLSDLNALLEPVTVGAPDDSPLRWTKSVRKLAVELQALGHSVSPRLVNGLLHEFGYTLQANRKTKEGTQHPDRDAPFHYLNDQVRRAQAQGQPVISVDTKAREGPRLHHPQPGQGDSLRGLRPEPQRGLGQRRDRPRHRPFRGERHLQLWKRMGRPAYPAARHLWITADAGGSNGPKLRLWKWQLQRFADRTGLTITVCHYCTRRSAGPGWRCCLLDTTRRARASGTASSIACSPISPRTGEASLLVSLAIDKRS